MVDYVCAALLLSWPLALFWFDVMETHWRYKRWRVSWVEAMWQTRRDWWLSLKAWFYE